MKVRVKQAGSYSCLVDLGRFHFRKYGVPASGPMDIRSAMRALSMVGNPIEYPLIESYLSGMKLEFDEDAWCSITGGEADVFINNQLITNSSRIKVESGDTLKIGRMRSGARTYIAIKGSIQAPRILDSVCYINGYYDNRLQKSDILQITPFLDKGVTRQSVIKPLLINPNSPISVQPGPEWQFLKDDEQESLLSQQYTVSSLADRMGYRLEGQAMQLEEDIEIYSSPVLPGTVQLLPSGLPLILMRDCQTTGGYPRVLQVAEDSIMQLAQRKGGDTVRFKLEG